jgi:hypothetical protein
MRAFMTENVKLPKGIYPVIFTTQKLVDGEDDWWKYQMI